MIPFLLVLLLLVVLAGAVLVVLSIHRTLAEFRNSLEAMRSRQDALLQPLLGVQEIKDTVRQASALHTRLQQDVKRVEDRLVSVDQENKTRDAEDRKTLESIANVVARTVRKGKAGEDIIRETLRALPPAYMVTNQPVKGGVVEFAIKLTDNRIMPLDSKWVASDLLNQYASETDDRRREEVRKIIEDRVLRHVKEVTKYLDTTVTTDLALCAIPDAAYELLTKSVTQAYQDGVLIVPYSQVLPLVLSLHHLFRRYTASIDVEALQQFLGQLRLSLGEMQTLLDNNFQKGSTMMQNAIDTYRQLLSTTRAGLLAVERSNAEPLPAPTDTVELRT